MPFSDEFFVFGQRGTSNIVGFVNTPAPSPPITDVDMPTGIPTPTFGLTETVESVYGSSTYYTYWVDNTHPSANNANNGGFGSPSLPRLTIPTGSFPAGTVIQVRGGPYTIGSGNLPMAFAGTASQPCFVTTGASRTVTYDIFGAVDTLSWTGQVNLTNTGDRTVALSGTYYIFEGFRLSGGNESFFSLGATTSPSTFCGLRDCETIGRGIALGNGVVMSLSNSTDAVISYNKLHEHGDYLQGAAENDLHGIGMGSNQVNTWALWNEVYHLGGDAIGNGHTSDFTCHHQYYGGNKLYACKENSIDIKECHTVVMSHNHCYDMLPSGTSPGEAMVFHSGGTGGAQQPSNLWVINNRIHNCRHGIVTTGLDTGNTAPAGVWIIGNLLYDNTNSDGSDAGIDPDRGGGTARIYHNTVDNWNRNIDREGSMTSWTSGGNCSVNTTVAHFRLSGSGTATVNKDNYYQGGSNVFIHWVGTNYTSSAAFDSAQSAVTGVTQFNPMFVDDANLDYQLQSGSPLIAAGIDMSTINDTFQSALGSTAINILKDIYGNDRPDGVWSVGCAEQAS